MPTRDSIRMPGRTSQCQDLRGEHPRRPDRGRPRRQGGLRGQRRGLSASSSTRSKPRSGPPSTRIPADRRKIITSHDAFGYFEAAYGVSSSRRRASRPKPRPRPRTWRGSSGRSGARRSRRCFLENVSDPRLIERIAQETGARIGGRLYSDALSDAERPGRHLHRHDATQYKGVQRGSVELTAFIIAPRSPVGDRHCPLTIRLWRPPCPTRSPSPSSPAISAPARPRSSTASSPSRTARNRRDRQRVRRDRHRQRPRRRRRRGSVRDEQRLHLLHRARRPDPHHRRADEAQGQVRRHHRRDHRPRRSGAGRADLLHGPGRRREPRGSTRS